MWIRLAKKVSNLRVKEAWTTKPHFLKLQIGSGNVYGMKADDKNHHIKSRRFMLQVATFPFPLNHWTSSALLGLFWVGVFLGRIVFLSICQFEGQSTLKHKQRLESRLRYSMAPHSTIIVIIIILCGHNHHAVHPIDDLSSPPKTTKKRPWSQMCMRPLGSALKANGQKPPNANIWMGGMYIIEEFSLQNRMENPIAPQSVKYFKVKMNWIFKKNFKLP